MAEHTERQAGQHCDDKRADGKEEVALRLAPEHVGPVRVFLHDRKAIEAPRSEDQAEREGHEQERSDPGERSEAQSRQ